jgi:hypothetical protein
VLLRRSYGSCASPAQVACRSRYRARIENVDDEDTRRQVDDAYRAKYHDQGLALNQVLSPQVREYTMRVILDKD